MLKQLPNVINVQIVQSLLKKVTFETLFKHAKAIRMYFCVEYELQKKIIIN